MYTYEFVKIDENLSKVVKGSYEIREVLKVYGGKWDAQNKYWTFPTKNEQHIKDGIETLFDRENRAKQAKWKQALQYFDLKYVSKGSEDYNTVLDFYKLL